MDLIKMELNYTASRKMIQNKNKGIKCSVNRKERIVG
jgi:hypothetical protein